MKKITISFPHKFSEFNNKISKIRLIYSNEWKSWGIIKYNKDDIQIGNGVWVHSKKEAIKQKKEWEEEFGIKKKRK
jgi:hypothetical protein